MNQVPQVAIDPLAIDAQSELTTIESLIRASLTKLRRRGVVIGLSGGVDSSVCAAICARALTTDRVVALLMPESDAYSESLRLGKLVAEHYGISFEVIDITDTLRTCHCYERRDAAIRQLIPGYDSSWKSKIVLPDLVGSGHYAVFHVIAQAPDGTLHKARVTPETYREIVASTNFKQRVRKMMEYYWADKLQYAVIGTPNRLEYEQGFFVKNGDGAADIKPIAHLYKSQVYALAKELNVPIEIQLRPPTTDTYSLEQSQEEFYFTLPYTQFDYCLYGRNNDLPAASVAQWTRLSEEEVQRAYNFIDRTRSATTYQHEPSITLL